MLSGLFLAALLPGISSLLRPALPFLVSVVLGLAIARMDVVAILREFIFWQKSLPLFILVLMFMPFTCLVFYTVWYLFQFSENSLFLMIIFGAAPPLSSAASLSLILGFNARITLQATLLATLATPVLGPLCFAMTGIMVDMEIASISFQIAAIIAGGFALGFGIQIFIGKTTIELHPQLFNGIVAIVMVLFLFPVFDGVIDHVLIAPWQSFAILILAVSLNIGGNLIVRTLSQRFSDSNTASALGLMFGNRNVAFYLAVLPSNPMLSIFVAASQFPMYATPAIFRNTANNDAP